MGHYWERNDGDLVKAKGLRTNGLVLFSPLPCFSDSCDLCGIQLTSMSLDKTQFTKWSQNIKGSKQSTWHRAYHIVDAQ